MSGMYLFGGLDHRKTDDIRPNVYEIGGLQMLTGAGEWIWRPVANRDTLQISAFVDENPRGFGLLQRNRSFSMFQDDDQHWELRPSLWIEPIGDWGEGQVQLLEIPTASENNGNIIAFWRPKAGLAEGRVAILRLSAILVLDSARAADARRLHRRANGKGGQAAGVSPSNSRATCSPTRPTPRRPRSTWRRTPARSSASRSFASAERKTLRVVFDLDPGSEAYSELRVVLESAGRPASETWLYRWTA